MALQKPLLGVGFEVFGVLGDALQLFQPAAQLLVGEGGGVLYGLEAVQLVFVPPGGAGGVEFAPAAPAAGVAQALAVIGLHGQRVQHVVGPFQQLFQRQLPGLGLGLDAGLDDGQPHRCGDPAVGLGAPGRRAIPRRPR